MAKLLVWTRGGFTIVHKRLEKGTFARVFKETSDACVEIDVHELSMLLEGIELANIKTSIRWEPKVVTREVA
jgi:transposase